MNSLKSNFAVSKHPITIPALVGQHEPEPFDLLFNPFLFTKVTQ